MLKISEATKAEILIEWFDTRTGQMVYDDVEFMLSMFGCVNITKPEEGWLTYTPTDETGKQGGEGELWFTFTHFLMLDEIARKVVVDNLRNIARLKMLDWDCTAPKDWELD